MRGRIVPRLFSTLVLALACALTSPVSAQSFSDQYLFLKAVKDGDGTKATELADRPGSTLINSRDLTTGETGLHIAVTKRDLTWIHFLTDRGANPNIADKKGVTPLMLASQLGEVHLVEALIEVGASINTSNNSGETPLILAIHRRDSRMVRALLAAGADPDRVDNSGRSARDYALYDGPGSSMMAEIELAERKAAAEEDEGPVYGPSF